MSSCLTPQMPSKCIVVALILIYDIFSALLGPKIGYKGNFRPTNVWNSN